MNVSEKLMWSLAQKSPTHRGELKQQLSIDKAKLEILLIQLERTGRVVLLGPDWVAASFYEVICGPSFEKKNRARLVEVGGNNEHS